MVSDAAREEANAEMLAENPLAHEERLFQHVRMPFPVGPMMLVSVLVSFALPWVVVAAFVLWVAPS